MTTPTLTTNLDSLTDALLAHDETEISRLQAHRDALLYKIRAARAAGDNCDAMHREYITTGDRLRALLVVGMDQPVREPAPVEEIELPPTPEGMAMINRALAEASEPSAPPHLNVAKLAKPVPTPVIEHVQLRRDVGHSLVHVLWHLTGSESTHTLNHPIGKQYGASYREAAEALDSELVTLRAELLAQQRRIAVIIAAAAWLRDH